MVATTRAETMLGDTAVAVHPEDERYKHMVGTTVELPLTGRQIPIVADEHVDPAFGTGAVKVTPAHDPNDFAIGQRHNLPVDHDHGRGRRHHRPRPVPGHGPVRGPARPWSPRCAPRAASWRRSAPTCTRSGHCSRCKTVVEPRLSLQWFVNVAPLAKAAGDAVRDGRVPIHPKELEPRWFDWVDNMHDWCISRQLWWGHRIPVWYGPDGEVVLRRPGRRSRRPARAGRRTRTSSTPGSPPACGRSRPWAGPSGRRTLAKFYPNSVLVTGYDILFFWVARMMMFGLYAMKDDAPSG